MLLFGTPTAYLLASRRFPGRQLCITFVELPLVLPPAVAGIALLATFGRFGLLGSTLERSGSRSRSRRPPSRLPSPSSPVRSTSVRRSPLSRRSTRTSSPHRARSAPGPVRTFFRVVLPLASGGLIAGRGARVRPRPRRVRRDDHVRRQPPRRTQTLPLAVYQSSNRLRRHPRDQRATRAHQPRDAARTQAGFSMAVLRADFPSLFGRLSWS